MFFFDFYRFWPPPKQKIIAGRVSGLALVGIPDFLPNKLNFTCFWKFFVKNVDFNLFDRYLTVNLPIIPIICTFGPIFVRCSIEF